MHVTSSAVDWYAARAAGVVAYVLLTGVVVIGIALAGKARSVRWPRFAVEEVHRYGGVLTGVFLALHVATIAIDSYTPFSLAQLVVPLASPYRPLWTALGIVAAELLVAVAVTNRLRGRISYRLWRRATISPSASGASRRCTASAPAPTVVPPGSSRCCSAVSSRWLPRLRSGS